MRLALSDDEAAFRDELREFFTTQIPAEIRERARDGEPRYPDDVGHRAAHPERARPGGAQLAGGVGRQGLVAAAAPDLGRRDAAGVRARAAGVQRQHGRPGDRPVRLPGAQGTLPAADRQSRHLVVPGLLRTRGRLRPGVAAHHRGARRRQLRHQRAEDLDDARPVRRLDLPARPHRSRAPPSVRPASRSCWPRCPRRASRCGRSS